MNLKTLMFWMQTTEWNVTNLNLNITIEYITHLKDVIRAISTAETELGMRSSGNNGSTADHLISRSCAENIHKGMRAIRNTMKTHRTWISIKTEILHIIGPFPSSISQSSYSNNENVRKFKQTFSRTIEPRSCQSLS